MGEPRLPLIGSSIKQQLESDNEAQTTAEDLKLLKGRYRGVL